MRSWNAFRQDLARYFAYAPGASSFERFVMCLTTDGIWALAVYRLGRAVTSPTAPFLVRAVGAFVYRILETAVRFTTGQPGRTTSTPPLQRLAVKVVSKWELPSRAKHRSASVRIPVHKPTEQQLFSFPLARVREPRGRNLFGDDEAAIACNHFYKRIAWKTKLLAQRGRERGKARRVRAAREALLEIIQVQTSYFRRLGRLALADSAARADFDRVKAPERAVKKASTPTEPSMPPAKAAVN